MSDAGWDSFPAAVAGRNFTRRTVRTMISNPSRLPGTWVTAEGVVVQIAEMKNSHLRNTIEMLRRESLKRLAKVLSRGDQSAPIYDVSEVRTIDNIEEAIGDPDARAHLAWGAVYLELLEEAMMRSDGDLEEWMAR